MVAWVAAGILIATGGLHSVLGEIVLVGPLLADRTWSVRVPRRAAGRILRFAWHLTTLAWWALAATLVGADVALTFGVTCLVSAAIVMTMVPGFIAWPLFVTAGVLGLWAAGDLPAPVLWTGVGLAAAVASVAAVVHLAWAAGSRRGLAAVLPQDPATGSPVRTPGRAATAAVAAALVGFVVVVLAEARSAGPVAVRWAVVAAVVVLGARVLGEGRWVGVSKSVRGTAFARADDRYWTPAVAVLALGALAALALGG
jgi:Protein of unknown function (DUF3995)